MMLTCQGTTRSAHRATSVREILSVEILSVDILSVLYLKTATRYKTATRMITITMTAGIFCQKPPRYLAMMILCVALPCIIVCGLCAGLHAKLCPCILGLNCTCTLLQQSHPRAVGMYCTGHGLLWRCDHLARNSMHFHAISIGIPCIFMQRCSRAVT
jgi:hypothetical protein